MSAPSLRSREPLQPARQRAAGGFSLIEMLVAVVLLSIAAVSLASMSIMAAKLQRIGRLDGQMWHAVHYQMESLSSMHYDSVSNGSAVVRGFPMSWTVQGADPKVIVLDVQTLNFSGNTVHDTIVTYLAPN